MRILIEPVFGTARTGRGAYSIPECSQLVMAYSQHGQERSSLFWCMKQIGKGEKRQQSSDKA